MVQSLPLSLEWNNGLYSTAYNRRPTTITNTFAFTSLHVCSWWCSQNRSRREWMCLQHQQQSVTVICVSCDPLFQQFSNGGPHTPGSVVGLWGREVHEQATKFQNSLYKDVIFLVIFQLLWKHMLLPYFMGNNITWVPFLVVCPRLTCAAVLYK